MLILNKGIITRDKTASPMTSYSASSEGRTVDAGFLDGLSNMFTGNLDYQRAIESANFANRNSALQSYNAYLRSAKEAEKQREFERYMSNTAYSRAVADLKSIGINPYAIGHFGPASTPTAATGTAYQAQTYSSGATSNTGYAGFKFLLDLFNAAAKAAFSGS